MRGCRVADPPPKKKIKIRRPDLVNRLISMDLRYVNFRQNQPQTPAKTGTLEF